MLSVFLQSRQIWMQLTAAQRYCLECSTDNWAGKLAFCDIHIAGSAQQRLLVLLDAGVLSAGLSSGFQAGDTNYLSSTYAWACP